MSLKKQDNILLTINAVALEFLKGSRSIQEFNKKKEFLLAILNGEVMTITKDMEDFAIQLSLVLQSPGGSTSPTDFYLASALMKYASGSKVYLLTKNHKDFPITLFDRADLVNIDGEHDVQTFGFYRFNQAKYENVLIKLTAK